jgi:hypothetical protein
MWNNLIAEIILALDIAGGAPMVAMEKIFGSGDNERGI